MVLIGLGPSAFDISKDVATIAKEVHIAARAPNITVGKWGHHDNIWLHKMVTFIYPLFFFSFFIELFDQMCFIYY